MWFPPEADRRSDPRFAEASARFAGAPARRARRVFFSGFFCGFEHCGGAAPMTTCPNEFVQAGFKFFFALHSVALAKDVAANSLKKSGG